MSVVFDDGDVRLIEGDVLDPTAWDGIEDGSVRTIVTSPPYFGLRDYGVPGQLGAEPTVSEYVDNLVQVFRHARRVLSDDGTLWLNLGDSFASASASGPQGRDGMRNGRRFTANKVPAKAGERAPKNLLMIPARVALALQDDGWILRSDIIWSKPNPMPESVTDRPTKAHEYLFFLAKTPYYYYDADAIAEPVAASTVARLSQPGLAEQAGSDRVPGKTNGPMKAVAPRSWRDRQYDQSMLPESMRQNGAKGVPQGSVDPGRDVRNARTVWTVPTVPFSEAHFAVYPPELIRPCIRAGSAVGDVVLDPFSGSGTTGMVAREEGRRYIGIDLNREYLDMSLRTRFAQPVMNIWGGDAA